MPPCRGPREPLRGEVLICPGFSPKAYICEISRYDKRDRTYPHRNQPAGDNHLPFEDEPQGVSDRDDEKNCASQQGKRILVQCLPPAGMEAGSLAGLYTLPARKDWADDGMTRVSTTATP
jgi:hypothetical protein